MAIVRFLLDTHALLWWWFNDPKLSPSAREVIGDPAHEIVVSSASAWEIATKHRLGRLPEAGDVVERFAYYLNKSKFSVLAISVEHALAAGTLPGPHKDPFDRMLIAKSKLEKMPVITLDPVFKSYGLSVIW